MNLMETSSITVQLNEPQHQAVTSDSPNLLVLAGAGSGKTRVLVHRIAWLIETGRARSSEIMAVTFTNKASNEIKGRVEKLLASSVSHMWVGTFHSPCHKFLRIHFQEAGLSEHFQIIDSDDQLRLIKKIHKEMNLSETMYPAKKSAHLINKWKENGTRAQHLSSDHSGDTTLNSVYQVYEEYCNKQDIVDFSELLLRCYELLQNNSTLLQIYQQRFKYILIDEFQDTNSLQYKWLQILSHSSSVTAVGDDDQSIYSWRGAIVDNLFQFEKDFEHTQTIRLEQNYRSTSTILEAANHLIANNTQRMSKELWTEDNPGEKIKLYCAYDEADEAKYITETISSLAPEYSLDEFAIFYRSNAQSRAIEERLNAAGIPYKIYGGFRFFDRAEIKDCLAYLRLWLNPNDDTAFERVINLPARGIGQATLEKIRASARENQSSMWQASLDCASTGILSARSKNSLTQFRDLIESWQNTHYTKLDELVQAIIDHSGLRSLYPTNSHEHTAKKENMDELINAVAQFQEKESLRENCIDCLSHMTLDSQDHNRNSSHRAVQLMTLHAAKGLEFTHVFITGLEESLFPHRGYDTDPNELEEERRLCYVGMTRAKQNLHLCYAEIRRIYGKEQFQRPSRFIFEVPDKYIQFVKVGLTHSKTPVATTPSFTAKKSSIRLGSRVRHDKFGEGTVLNLEGDSSNLRIQIHFESCGVKWLLMEYANLTFL